MNTPSSSRRRRSRSSSSASTNSAPLSSGSMLIIGFLTLCLILGGSSSGGLLANATLQLLAALLLGYGITRLGNVPLSRSAKVLVAIVLCWVAWGIVQLVPLPPSLWTAIPGHQFAEERLRASGMALPWLPLSMNPAGTIRHLASLLPPLAIGVTILSRPASDSMGLRWAIPALALLSLLIGVAQLIGGAESGLYFYRLTNQDLPVGLMANGNHQATLMLCALPFLASLAGNENSGTSRGRELLLAALAIMFLIGVGICQSYAGYVLILPVLTASWLIARPRSLGPARYIGVGIGVLTLAALIFVITGPESISKATAIGGSPLSRPTMYAVTAAAIRDFLPFGSGYGSFVPIYKLFEDPLQVNNVFANHAHSDYLELLLEGGIPGLLLVLALIGWWIRRGTAIWFGRSSSRFDRAIVVATAAILGHSLVDYPARTSAIAAILAAGFAVMARRDVEIELPETPIGGGRHLSAE